MTPLQVIEDGITDPRGSYKVLAALGELLSAHSAFNLWLFHCIRGRISVPTERLELAGRRSTEVPLELENAWLRFLKDTEEDRTHAAASAEIVRVLRGVTAELRGYVGEIDIYDDDVLPPFLPA